MRGKGWIKRGEPTLFPLPFSLDHFRIQGGKCEVDFSFQGEMQRFPFDFEFLSWPHNSKGGQRVWTPAGKLRGIWGIRVFSFSKSKEFQNFDSNAS